MDSRVAALDVAPRLDDTIHAATETTQLQVTFWMTIVWSIMRRSPDKVSLKIRIEVRAAF